MVKAAAARVARARAPCWAGRAASGAVTAAATVAVSTAGAEVAAGEDLSGEGGTACVRALSLTPATAAGRASLPAVVMAWMTSRRAAAARALTVAVAAAMTACGRRARVEGAFPTWAEAEVGRTAYSDRMMPGDRRAWNDLAAAAAARKQGRRRAPRPCLLCRSGSWHRASAPTRARRQRWPDRLCPRRLPRRRWTRRRPRRAGAHSSGWHPAR